MLKPAILALTLSFSASVFASDNFEEVKARALRDVSNAIELTKRQQAIAAVAALTALEANQDLRALTTKAIADELITREEVALMLNQLSSYCGFPKVSKAFDALAGIVSANTKLDLSPDENSVRYEIGKEAYVKLNPEGYDILVNAFDKDIPNLPATTFPLFADSYAPPGLSLKDRQLATLAALTAMGNANAQLRFHIGTARNVGLSDREITDVMVLMQYFAGMPAAYNGALAAKEVLSTPKHSSPYR